MSDDRNIRPRTFRRRARRVLENNSSDSSSEDDVSRINPVRKRRALLIDSSSSDESSSSSIINPVNKRRKLVFEESSWETDSETEISATKTPKHEAPIDSDSSDGQSDKCPICLVSLKTQEIGTPESCDHMFCVECIQEWSKNMNTCPVDRQEYRMILVRQSVSGNIYKQIPVDPPTVQEDELAILEDPTFCEVCGLSDREDTMLLCDGCDLGYHMHCLQPPLHEIPVGSWFCNDCPPGEIVNREIELYEVQLLLDDAHEMERPTDNRRRANSRLVPRTRHSERVLRRIAESRINRRSTIFDGSPVETNTNIRRRRRRGQTQRSIRYRTVYEIDETTGETITFKKRIKRRKRKKKPRIQLLQSSSGVRRRLAAQIGICNPRNKDQSTPDVRVPTQVRNLQSQRFQAGIPTLSLFGPRDELSYFSHSDNEGGGSLGILRSRAPNRQDVAMLRRVRMKTLNVPDVAASSTNILDSILKTQEQLYSRNTKFSLERNGKFSMQPSDLNLNNYNQYVRRRPYSENSRSNDSVPSSSGHGNQYGGNLNSPEQSSTAPTSTVETNTSTSSFQSGNSQDFNTPQDYTQTNLCTMYDVDTEENKKDAEKDEASENNTPRSGTPASESEIDIYSDIETVSTSKADDNDIKELSPVPNIHISHVGTDEDSDGSDNDMVIDTEKANTEPEENAREETAVTSTVDSNNEITNPLQAVTYNSEIQSQAIQSSNQLFDDKHKLAYDDEDSEDGCPNFSIYSKESINLAKNTDITLPPYNTNEQEDNQVKEVSSSPAVVHKETLNQMQRNNVDEEVADVQENDNIEELPVEVEEQFEDRVAKSKITSNSGLYSDSEDETIVKRGVENSFGISDIRNMTEDISEEERSYTPCLDERGSVFREGLEGLDTEMISDEERNDFDEAQELKTASDGDALEINAKESELDFTRPEDYEEGEIVDKSKKQTADDTKSGKDDAKKVVKKKDETGNKNDNKENESHNNNSSTNLNNRESAFKKLSKNNKERNYRDKDRDNRDRSKSREKKSRDNKREKKREKRKEIERYDVRALIAEKPRRLKDQFGRDIRRTPSRSATRTPSPKRSLSRNHKSVTPRRSASKQRSASRGRGKKKKRRSSRRLSFSRSRSLSFSRRRSRSKTKKRPRTLSRDRRKKSRERNRSKTKATKKRRSRSRHSRSPTPRRSKDWSRRQSREWTPSLSRSHTPEPRHLTPSWTPPRLMENSVNPRNLTVILTNNANKKKKEKKKKQDKRPKESERPKKRRRSDRTPPPSKEVFASGDNILVSVSFNKDNETRDVSAKRRRNSEDVAPKKPRKEKVKKTRKKNKDLTGIKPVAIIDLDRSPFKEITPSPKDVIVLSDSDNEGNRNMQKTICDSSQLVTSPERLINTGYLTGPKTPPEPQVKFTLQSKQTQMRAISNPLHEPDDIEPEENTEELDDDASHKGPNTPPEPPNSPPSSPDAYDPFEPTKSRSPTPEPIQATQSSSAISLDDNRDDSIIENRCAIEIEKSTSVITITPDNLKSHTPPLADVQPADSQSSLQATPESSLGKSPDHTSTGTIQPQTTTKPVAQTIPFSSVPTSIITATPVSAGPAPSRINILNTTIITPSNVVSSIPQRIVLPNTVKSSPVKISPTKAAVKSTPIKPLPMKTSANSKSARKSNTRIQNGNDSSDQNLNLDSPYSPGSSDYEDLFEPPTELSNLKQTAKQVTKKSPVKVQNAFDSLFGSSPFQKVKVKDFNKNTNKSGKKGVQSGAGKGTKQVGVKIDEDNLKILDDLPNSAVEMQVKDKFLKKLNRQERVVEEVKLVLKPHYNKKHVNKDEYKDILRRAVPKICHNKSGEINPTKIKNLIEAYVKKVRHSKKVTSSSSVNPQKP